MSIFLRWIPVVLAVALWLAEGRAQAPLRAEPVTAVPAASGLEDEVRRLQRDTIDLQKNLMESGLSGATKADVERLKMLGTLESELSSLKKEGAEMRAALAEVKAGKGAEGGKAMGEAWEALVKSNEAQTFAINMVWTLVAGFLVMFMQAGFAMVETGFTRAKNAAHTMSMNFMVYALGMLGFWFCGFGIMFGGTAGSGSVSTVTSLGPEVGENLNRLLGLQLGDGFWGFFGGVGYCLPPSMLFGSVFTLFLFQMVFMDTTATIPTGSMAERWRFLPFCIYALCVGAFIYPIYGCWVWGGGWLAALGKNLGLGNGHVDFAGSSVVHLCGGVLAYVGARVLGPRHGKFNRDGSPNPIPGHNIPMGIVGTFILAFGWFGFNAGSTLAGMDTQIGVIATNTMLASAAGALTGMVTTWVRFKRPDPSFMCNGMLAGLVAVTAPCAFVDSWAAVFIGAVAGVLVVFSAMVVEEKLRLDDPVGAVSVHGANGAWGVLALGLFANGKYGAGWNGVATPVTGFFYGNPGQLAAEVIGILACIVAVGGMGWVVFAVLEKLIGNRVAEADEIAGLDIPELGVMGYQEDVFPEVK